MFEKQRLEIYELNLNPNWKTLTCDLQLMSNDQKCYVDFEIVKEIESLPQTQNS